MRLSVSFHSLELSAYMCNDMKAGPIDSGALGGRPARPPGPGILIPDPKQSSNDIDVYLKPLIEELLLLWKDEGVRMWDAHAEDHFNLRALLFVTTNDWPALSNLSGQSNKGYRACTHCLEETDSTYSSTVGRSCIWVIVDFFRSSTH